jgi:hypothetical protein
MITDESFRATVTNLSSPQRAKFIADDGECTVPTLNRKGVSWDRRARQFTCRVGYRFNHAGKRARGFQYLTGDPETATLQHITLLKDWERLEADWPALRRQVVHGLPEHLVEADLSKPVWVRPEWIKAAERKLEQLTGQVIRAEEEWVADYVRERVETVERVASGQINTELASVTESAHGWAKRLSPELIARASQARVTAETVKVGPQPQRLSIREAAVRYLHYKAEKIGLTIPGLRKGGGMKPHTPALQATSRRSVGGPCRACGTAERRSGTQSGDPAASRRTTFPHRA